MDKITFYVKLATILDVEEVMPDNTLADFESWDSLSALSILALADSEYGVTLRAEELRSAVTAEDLANLLEAKRK
jgi:acyl carrier protein